MDGLLARGPKSVVITSGREKETGRHVVWGFDGRAGEYFTVPYRFIKAHFPGTGDIFTSLLTSQLMGGRSLPQAVRRAVETLTGRGLQVVRMTMEGKTNPEIAAELGVSVNTVKFAKRRRMRS